MAADDQRLIHQKRTNAEAHCCCCCCYNSRDWRTSYSSSGKITAAVAAATRGVENHKQCFFSQILETTVTATAGAAETDRQRRVCCSRNDAANVVARASETPTN